MVLDDVIGWVARAGHWGYAIVFLGAMLESAAMLGLFVPGEALVLAAGFLAAKGVFEVTILISVVTAGAALGDSIGYEMGRRLDLDRFGPRLARLGLTQERIGAVQGFFKRHGGKSVFLGRFVGFARALVPFLAGSAHMRYRIFLAYNLSGALLWSAIVVLLGYFIGAAWHQVAAWMGRLSAVAFGLAVLYGLFHIRDKIRHIPWDLAALAGSLWAFGGITEDVLTNDPLAAHDRAVAAWVAAHRLDAISPAVVFFTDLHSPLGLTLASLLIGGLLALSRQWRWLTTLAAVMVGGALLNTVMKLAFHRERPDSPLVGMSFHSFSFPSGHVAGATLFYGFLAVYASTHLAHREGRTAAVGAAVAMVVLVALSRMYVGAHYLSDVLAAMSEGVAWLTICMLVLFGRFRRPAH